MLRIAFVFVSFYLIGSAAAGSCSNNSTSGKMPNGNTKCPQYNSDSCCTSQFTYIKESCTIDDGCKIGQTCFDLINLVQCANECRPDMSLLVDNNSGWYLMLNIKIIFRSNQNYGVLSTKGFTFIQF
jgi:NDP-sugar pyrophosphorylase family protein